MNKQKKSIATGALFMAITLILFLPGVSFPGSLEPTPDAVDTSGNPMSTMKTLNEIPPTWSKKLPCDSMANCPRFEVLADFNNEAVLDKETGLVWQRSPWNYQGNWWNAQNTCIGAMCKGGRCGWRLPTIHELQSLVDFCDNWPWYLPCGHPFINANGCYWSSTDSPFDFNKAVSFCSGTGWDYDDKTGEYFGAWCVRGGLGVELGVSFHY